MRGVHGHLADALPPPDPGPPGLGRPPEGGGRSQCRHRTRGLSAAVSRGPEELRRQEGVGDGDRKVPGGP